MHVEGSWLHLVGRPTQLIYISDIYLSFQPSAVVRAIYPPPIWGPSRQLDDQHRNTNMKNKDHLVGQLTSTT